jgi:predicted DNA-binding transcriptional regulator AlpA
MFTTNSPSLTERRYLKSGEVMRALGYSDRPAFWAAIKAAGIPFIRVNSRRCLFDEAAVLAWLDERTIGGRS